MVLVANERQRAAFDKKKQCEADLERIIRESRLKPKHTAKEPNKTAPITRKPAGTPKGFRISQIETPDFSELPREDDERLLIEVCEAAFEALPAFSPNHRRVALSKAEEADRIEAERQKVEKRNAKGAKTVTLTRDGRNYTVRKFQTRAEKLTSQGFMRHHLLVALDEFGALVGDALGVAVHDTQSSTSKHIACYDGGAGSTGFTSKTPADRQLIGQRALRLCSAHIPSELRSTFCEIVAETVGYRSPVKRTLAELGNYLYGYKSDRQAGGAGAATVVCIAAMVNHWLKSKERRECERISIDSGYEENLLQAA